ncbi:glycosyltransferase involved in cell wall biosynthesis [Halanaerobium congolense]|uniref:Glycosyltransferase involved in cell wall biosynthesis n=1 Tax=Halanaerobium congolense TaxID=54121 RepID=A0A318E3R9_9FIRM|nr:glycosyltransferase family 4 protein [Halanaerobium congolense]PXV62297.1 glycosyltransferase involved in cell wall biosynthesis [Halanaerobium congolense]
MKIIHVEDHFDPTAGYQINELLYASKNFDDEVYLITSDDMSPFHKSVDLSLDKKFEKETGIKIVRLKSLFKLSARLILKNLTKTIQKINPDAVFMHGIADFKDLILLKQKQDFKIVRDCHMSWVAAKNKFRKPFYLFYKLTFANIINKTDKYNKIYALGNEELEYLHKIGIKDKKIDFLPHGFNDNIMYYDEKSRHKIRKKFNLKNNVVISYIGKLNESKRPDLIIDIINELDKKFINVYNISLLFIGPKDKNYMNLFNEKLNTLNFELKYRIEDSKPFQELRKYFSASDILIFPKQTTLSSIHAQVCGCPVIMENYKSNQERVINNDNLYPKDDFKKASEILKKIILNKEYIKDDNIENKFILSDREYKNQIKKLYKDLK